MLGLQAAQLLLVAGLEGGDQVLRSDGPPSVFICLAHEEVAHPWTHTQTHTHTHTQSHSLAQEVERVKGPMTCH